MQNNNKMKRSCEATCILFELNLVKVYLSLMG